jgi:hypothetical protein
MVVLLTPTEDLCFLSLLLPMMMITLLRAQDANTLEEFASAISLGATEYSDGLFPVSEDANVDGVQPWIEVFEEEAPQTERGKALLQVSRHDAPLLPLRLVVVAWTLVVR